MNTEPKKADVVDDWLGSIQKVESPDFLLMRIHAELDDQLTQQISIQYVWAGAVLCSFLLLLNIWTIQTYSLPSVVADGVILLEEMNLIPDNGFY